MKKSYCTILLIWASLLSNAQGIDESLFSFDFKMDEMPVPERSKPFSELGYKVRYVCH